MAVSIESTANDNKRSPFFLNNRQLWLNLVSACLIGLVVIGGFYKTVLEGTPISRLYQLGQRDTLFAKYFVPIREGYDASVYQFFVPSHEFLVSTLRKGTIPLWNPLVGCGEPFLADIETATFWPLRLALLWMEPLRSWNLLIVINLLVFGIGTFLLGSLIHLRRFAAIFAALLCAFSPFLIFHSELIGSSSSWIPLVIASFIYAERARSTLSKALAGAACATMIISGHPEPSFFGIVCASLIYLLLRLLQSQKKEFAFSFLKALAEIAIIGLFAFGFAAPILLPFFEHLRSSDCYKLGLVDHRSGVPINSILVNLIHPAYEKCSPFFGVIALPLVLTGCALGIKRELYLRAFAICAVILIALMSQLGPLDWLMNLKAFSWFVPKYCFPALLVVLAVSCGYGMQEVIDGVSKDWKKTCYWLVGTSIAVLAGLIAIKFVPSLLECVRQDEAFEHMAVVGKLWTRDIIILTVFCCIITASKLFGKIKSIVCVLAIAVCSILSVAPVAKLASPPTMALKYELFDPIPFLRAEGARILTVGRHTFCPSSNFAYGINNIVPVNVYHPKGFLDFLQLCGITPEGVNQFFDNDLSAAINTASVKYVVSPLPVTSSSIQQSELAALKDQNASTAPRWKGSNDSESLTLSGGSITLYPENREMVGNLKFRTSYKEAKHVGIQPFVLDDKGAVTWFGDPERLLYLFHANDTDAEADFEKTIKIPLPEKYAKNVVGIQLFDFNKPAYLNLANRSGQGKLLSLAKLGEDARSIESELLADCKVVNSSADSQIHFKLVSENPAHIRVYENLNAAPLCYLSRQIDTTRDLKSFLLWQQNGTTSEKTIFFEAQDRDWQKRNLWDKTPGEQSKIDNVSWTRPTCNSVQVELIASTPAVLVLSEFNQDAWNCNIVHNGETKEAPIVKTNGVFQSVTIPEGKSVVTFSYSPRSFTAGVLVLAFTLLALFFFFIRQQRKN